MMKKNRSFILTCILIMLIAQTASCMVLGVVDETVDGALTYEMPVVLDEPVMRVRIRAVGDLMNHDKQIKQAKRGDGTYDFHEQYAQVADSLADADYTIANLETTLGIYKDRPYSGFPFFNAPESLLDTLRDCGIDFLTLANNHILDRYFDGMIRTVDSVEAYGFAHGGAYRTQEEADDCVVVEVNGVKLGMLCYTEHTNGMERYCNANAVEFGVDYLKNADFKKDVQQLKDAGADVIIAMPHWGTELERTPDHAERNYAAKMVAAGVDVILGSHPHVVQPIEYLTAEDESGEEHTALVVWSMGNFIANMARQGSDAGIIVEFTVVMNNGKPEICDVGYVPTYCWMRESANQTLCVPRYSDSAPKGMGKDTYKRMLASAKETIRMMGDKFKVLEK